MQKKLSRFKRLGKNARAFLDERTLASKSGSSRLYRFVHFWVLVCSSFARNRGPVRASALAYATILALVPMLAVVVSISSSVLKQEGEDRIDQFVTKLVDSLTPPAVLSTNSVPPAPKPPAAETGATNVEARTFVGNNSSTNPPANSATAASNTNTVSGQSALSSLAHDEKAVAARKEVARQIHQFIQNTRSGALGVTGSLALIFVAISMLSRIETTFNDIWGVASGRNWFMRIVLYWGVLTLAPLLLIVAVGLASGPYLTATRQFLQAMPFVGNFAFEFVPIVLLCLTFAAFYMLMPNTHVDWKAALVGGSVAACLFHLNNLVSVLYVSRVVSNSKIYGSLGLVPVFIIGLYFAWLIMLFGAQVAYGYQNRGSYLEERQVEIINQRGREFVALRLMTAVGQRFVQHRLPPSIPELAEELRVPARLLREIAQTLAAERLLAEIAVAAQEPAYLPTRPLEATTCHDILLALRATRGQELATRDEPIRGEVYGEFHRIEEAERQAASKITLLDLVHHARPQIAGGSPSDSGS